MKGAIINTIDVELAAEEMVEDVVLQKIKQGDMFTSHDVTHDEVRARVGHGLFVPHDEVREEVHALYENGGMAGYTRTLANFPHVSPVPWIYHKRGDIENPRAVRTI